MALRMTVYSAVGWASTYDEDVADSLPILDAAAYNDSSQLFIPLRCPVTKQYRSAGASDGGGALPGPRWGS